MRFFSTDYIYSSNVLLTAATVLVWEILTTLDDEVNYIWKQPWTLGTFLFWANRYLPFFDTIIAMRMQFSRDMSPAACRTHYLGMTWVMITGLILAEFIIILRTWAIWKHKRSVRIFLAAMSFCTLLPAIATLVVEIHSFRFAPTTEHGYGCNLVYAERLIVVPYCMVAISETVVVILTLARGINHLSLSSKTSWVGRVYGYGLMFYIYLLVFTLINIVVPLVAQQPRYKSYLAVSQHVFHSIFCTRVILFIQRQRWARRSGAAPRTDDDNDDNDDCADSHLYTRNQTRTANQTRTSDITESVPEGDYIRQNGRDRDIELTAYQTGTESTHGKDWTQ
ncbi:hypothetical protein BJ912DRAFT_352814 [Pholiota molesta]|nr:hypothetical protein BJ912DRAFT_352814 [Pholiota molesta]